MKKVVGKLFLLCFFVLAATSNVYAIPIEVGSYGETGWQTYVWNVTGSFTGHIGFLVSDTYDFLVSSQLLVDNILLNGGLWEGFEGTEMPAGGYGFGADPQLLTSYTHQTGLGTTFTPQQGSQMLMFDSVDGWSGASTSAFRSNASDGTYGYLPISLSAGDILSVDWNFMTDDYWNLDDFAMLLMLPAGAGEETILLAHIGHNGAVPEPATMSLLSLGFLGFGFFRRKKRK